MAVEQLRWHQLDDAPARPGLYAWYMVPRIGKANAAHADTARTALRTIALKLRFPNVDLTLQGHLSLELAGELRHQHIGEREQLPSTLEALLATNESRDFLTSIMAELSPWFAAPLYIGVSNDLRRRLRQHRAYVAEPSTSIHIDDETDGTEAIERDRSFGAEVRNRAISPNDLIACVLPIDAPPASLDARKAIEGVETLLNRVFYPIFGRR